MIIVAANAYFGHVLDTDLAAFEKTVDVNICDFFFILVEVGKLMMARGGGVIVNTVSVRALQQRLAQGIYSITKVAVINMTKNVPKLFSNLGVTCNAILPALEDTKVAGALFTHQDIYSEVISIIHMGHHAEPNKMAGTVIYLDSDDSSYTNGECIVVNGGLTI
jgi:NAD(P)-dependent dehydrogenase (short-subunit alcohol dehydrogenase family)